MPILVFETDSHRQRQLTEEGSAFLETYGEVEIIRQADRQDKEAFAQFLERVPIADGAPGTVLQNHPSRLAIC